MEKNLLLKIGEASSEISKMEQQYIQIYNTSLNIEDVAKFQEVQLDIYHKIRRLKAWNEVLNNLRIDVEMSTDLKSEVQEPVIEMTEKTIETTEKTVEEVIIPKMATTDEVYYENYSDPFEKKTREPAQPVEKSIENTFFNNTVDYNEVYNKDFQTNTFSSDFLSKPLSFTLLDKTYPFESWDNVLKTTLEAMLLNKPFILAKFNTLPKLKDNDSINFSYNRDEIQGSKDKLNNGLWFKTGLDEIETIDLIIRSLEVCGYSDRTFEVHYQQ